MAIRMKIARAPIFLVLGGMSALLFGLITCYRNLSGWALALWGAGLLVESLGLSHHLVHPKTGSGGATTRKEYLAMAGILSVSIIPALDFLAFPAALPRTPGMMDAGLILCALGLLLLLRSKISWEFWIREDVLVPALRPEINGGPNHANRFLEYAGVVFWAAGICIGFASLAGIVAALALLVPGLIPRKPRET